MAPVYYCSPLEAAEEALCAAHSEVQKLLNQTTAGRCLYTGERRRRLVAVRDQLELAILSGEPLPGPANRLILAALG